MFKSWYKSNADWVSLHLHGYDHSFPPENTRNYILQEALINLGRMMLSEVIERESFGYKAPGYYSNRETRQILQKFNFLFLSHLQSIEWLVKPANFTTFALVQSHTNGTSPDSIERIQDQILNLADSKFLTFDELYEKENTDSNHSSV
jgi:predicted deacetylase